MTLTAITTPLRIRVEVKNPTKQLFNSDRIVLSDRIVIGFCIFAIFAMIIVTARSTASLVAIGPAPRQAVFNLTHNCHNDLEYCSLTKQAITWPPGELVFISTDCSCPE